MRISGTDYCDKCTKIKHALKIIQDPQSRLEMQNELQTHRDEADVEFLFYKEMKNLGSEFREGPTLHLIFEFAEKVLLPSLIEQPGILHFFAGLRFNLFGLSSSKMRQNFIFGLPEGF